MTSAHVASEIVSEIEVTPDHPLFAEEEGWAGAGSLRPGMMLRTDHGPVGVASLASAPGGRLVYNLDDVEGAHTYRVSADQVWSHNACCLRPEAKYLRGGKHGLKWKEGRNLAKDEGVAQGQWGSMGELDYTGEKAATLAPNQWREWDLPPGSKSVVWMTDGTVIPENRFMMTNNGTGTWHGSDPCSPRSAAGAEWVAVAGLTPIDKF